jgi:hypothetical protein
MPTQMRHSGGLVDVVLELGFDQVRYFEGDITGTATGFTISPPARRITVINQDSTNDVFLRINPPDGEVAETTVGFTPGDNIKIGPGCNFTMDFDSLSEISLVTEGATVAVEGILGWKGIHPDC